MISLDMFYLVKNQSYNNQECAQLENKRSELEKKEVDFQIKTLIFKDYQYIFELKGKIKNLFRRYTCMTLFSDWLRN